MPRKPAAPKPPKVARYVRGERYGPRLHRIRQDYFSSIDTPIKAYMLGFLYADGCVGPRGATIALQARDRHILLRFRDELYPDRRRPLIKILPKQTTWKNGYVSQSGLAYSLLMYSVQLSKDLVRAGCLFRKTKYLRFPFKRLSVELYPDFIRGYFDGDGSMCETFGKNHLGQKLKRHCASFAANDSFSKDLVKALSILGLSFKINQGVGTKIVQTSKKSIIYEFYNKLWYPDCICLSRKRHSFERFVRYYQQRRQELGRQFFENTFKTKQGTFAAEVQVNNVSYGLGRFNEPEEAALMALSFKNYMGVL